MSYADLPKIADIELSPLSYAHRGAGSKNSLNSLASGEVSTNRVLYELNELWRLAWPTVTSTCYFSEMCFYDGMLQMASSFLFAAPGYINIAMVGHLNNFDLLAAVAFGELVSV